MTEKRVQFNNIVKNQLPQYVREEFPLVSEFLSQYYLSQEYQGGAVDLIQNIDNYIKLNEITNLNKSVVLGTSMSYDDDIIYIDLDSSPKGTTGFPDSYGLLKIDDEIITYTGKTFNSFTGCIRGFSGVSSYQKIGNPEDLVFESTLSQEHSSGTEIENLSVLFLNEFLRKVKKQFLPGFEDRSLAVKKISRVIGGPTDDYPLDQNIFIKQSKDFYSSKGTDQSFKILFSSLYGENVEVVRPKEFLFRPSDAGYKITNDLIVESILGNPFELKNLTLKQDNYKDIDSSYAPVTKVEKINAGISTNSYYKISLDSGYDRDIRVDGAIYGKFSVHPKTKILGQVSIGQTYIDVDSTVGFPHSGELYVVYPSGNSGVINYNSKSLTQFFECSGITETIPDNTPIDINTFAYSFVGIGSTNKIEVKIRSVLNSLNINDTGYYHSPGEKVKIKTLGISPKDKALNNWFFNTSPTFNVKSIIETTSKNYQITLFDKHSFRINDRITVNGSDNSSYSFVITNILSDKIIDCEGPTIQNLALVNFTVKRNRLKTSSTKYLINNFDANVQNTYQLKNKTLVSSSSIPHYSNPIDPQILSYSINGQVGVGSIFKITSNVDHGFYTGDSVYYTPQKEGENIVSSLFDEGIYYVKRIDQNNIKLSRSRSDIFNDKFIILDSEKFVTNNRLELLRFKGKTFTHQKLLREISDSVNDGRVYPTLPGQTGILVNGVEILNYKSKDLIYYGDIQDVEVISGGQDYDIINLPQLIIQDQVGTGATGYCSIKGSLKEIRISDPGFDYLETPDIIISGGNGVNATAKAILTDTLHEVSFNSEEKTGIVNIANNTLGFTTYHKFRNNELIIYKTFSQDGIPGLTTDAKYYVSVQNSTTVKLHETFEDSVSGINTIPLVGYGKGNHAFEAFNKKKIVSSIIVTDSGSGYENKKRTCSPTGINTSLDTITIKNHDYNSGELITYSVDGSSIGGLSTTTKYYVTKLDNNTFKLSNVGLTTNSSDFFYKTKQYVNLESVGVGTHTFNYPSITVNVVGNVGIASVSNEEFKCKVQPIFQGEITSVHLSNGGVGYGSSDIINFFREPNIEVYNGSGAVLYPIVVDGKITEVLINDVGNFYTSPPEIIVDGNGTGASLTPILTNGQITSVRVINSGRGYSQNLTTIKVISSGSGVKFKTKLKTWEINLFKKYYDILNEDDGVLVDALNKDYGIQYCHLYAPRELRKILYSTDLLGNPLYLEPDLKVNPINNTEIISETENQNHSPIIGWAYDGNPIYGPYGYSTKNGGVVVKMKSGYKESLKSNRPSFPLEFFIEDFDFFPSDDETVLDENNGRFCKTPDFPDGVYAYFATFEDALDQGGIFGGYRRPKFPYLIGKNYHSLPNQFNFNPSSNQDKYDLNTNTWLRNSSSYNFDGKNSSYDYLTFSNKFKEQTSNIKTTSVGSVENIGIVTGGLNYRVNDKVSLDLSNTKGQGFSAKVSRLSGKEVSLVSLSSTTINNIEFYPLNGDGSFIGFSSLPHGLSDFDLIKVSGLSTTSSFIEGSYRVGINTNKLSISGVGTTSLGISSTGVTGIVTYIPVTGNLIYPNIRENDILQIEDEKVKVLNIDTLSSRIRVLRQIDNTIGVAHSANTSIFEISKKFNINSGYSTSFSNLRNKEIYFNPVESIGLGTISGVGIGSTLIFSNPGAGVSEIFIPTKTIYLPEHKLETGDSIVYSSNGGSTIAISTNGSSSINVSDGTTFFVAKITSDLIGISTVKVGLGTTGTFVGIASTTSNQSTVYFTGIGTGDYHSFKANYSNILTGRIDKNTAIVSTAETHGLKTGDNIVITVNPSIATTYHVKYNEYNRRVTVGSKTFTSADIDIHKNSINISNHKLYNGQVAIHTSSSPSGGLENEKIYYVYVVDEDTIKLTESLYDSTSTKPSIVNITSSSNGTLSLVNPPIEIYKNSTLHFDLTDNSLSHFQGSSSVASFDFNIFTDKNFSEKYEKIKGNDLIVNKIGTVGVSTNAKVTITVDQDTPQILYYNLTPTNLISIPTIKKEIIVDEDAYQNNTIFVKNSLYNGSYEITVSSGSTFSFNLFEHPESTEYTKNTSSIKYDTNSITAFGPIKNIDIINKGFGFDIIPGISTVLSNTGSNALLEPQSSSIGIIKKVEIDNIGFDYSADSTVRPTAKIPQVLKVEPLSSFDFVGVTSAGIGYVTAPKLIVIDGNTKKLVPDIDLRYNIEDDTVDILKNTKGLFAVTPKIIPTQNCNGVGISSISYNSSTKDVTVFLSVGFTTVGGFPFSVNDKIIIENVGIKTVGAGSTYKGYNSENYNYELFNIKSINPNYGGFGANIVYNLDGLLLEEEPGEFDPIRSSGRVIPEKYFPIFNVILKKNDFFIGEDIGILGDTPVGKLVKWDPITEYVTVESGEDFDVNKIILGKSSNSQALIKESVNFDTDYIVDSFSKVLGNWSYDAGFLNENSQRIQDSFYYQNFSYSLKSKIDYDTWDDPVSNLNHTAGFKKFSDYQLESKLFDPNSMIVGLTTNTTDIDLKVDLTGVVDLNCVYNFDLVRENALNINSKLVSDEIIFNSTILSDYLESVSNRVLIIDDISNQFNSNPRSSQYSIVHRVPISFARAQKYIIYTRDMRYTDERQLTIASFLIDNNDIPYLNQYGLEGIDDLGDYDVTIDGTDAILQFYPIKYQVNDYDITTISFNLKDTLSSIGNIDFGCVSIATSSIFVSTGVSTTIVGIATTYTSSKVLVELATPTGLYQYDEINLVHDGTDVRILEFGRLNNLSSEDYVGSGIGTYNAYISGSNINVDFKPNPGIAATVNLVNISIADTSSTGIGTYQMRHVLIRGTSTSIASTSSPIANVVETYPAAAGAAYFIVQVSDTTNNRHQMSEVLVIDNETYSQTFQTEYGVIETVTGLGTIGSVNSTSTNLTFTPLPNIDVVVKVYMNAFTFDESGSLPDQIDLNNVIIETDFSDYYGTETDVKRQFGLTYETKPIFVRNFLGNSESVVDISKNTVTIPNHFFVTGEKLSYSYEGTESDNAIGIATTSVVGLGTTDKLPSTVYAVKVDEKTLKFAENAENALKAVPVTFDLTSVGIGTSHTLYAHNQNNKVLITLDNNIQSPIVSTSQTTSLARGVSSIDDIIYFTGITSFFGGDLVRIGDEILRIDGVGIGSTNAIRVRRSWLGTNYAGYSTGSLVTKVVGNYNIVGNAINFVTAPYGNIPLTTSTAAPDSRDWLGISTSSKFHGRMFMRSGEINGANETYYRNYIFDDISDSFTGIANTFSLKSSGSNVTGISTSNAIILINEIFQNAGATQNYTLTESSGETKITFVGTAQTIGYDVGISSFPRGGMIVSVGSSAGYGYQPLVAAGGTAIVSTAGTIQSISIGNSGSGYRVGIQTVRVGVTTSTTGTPSIHFIGTATVSNGNIVSVAITNPGAGYTTTNPPYVIFDYPLSYSNIPLVYASNSIQGIGQSASINVTVGQGSSVIDFELQSTGFGYGQGEILTLPIGGNTGIPTTSGYVPFELTIDRTINDSFSGWSVGDLDVLDSFDDLFDGDRRTFGLKKAGETISIVSAPGSPVRVEYTLLIFINDILQIPGEGYNFNGGNIITFTEAPKEGDRSKVIFYKGSGSVDVVEREILDTVKVGDTLTIGHSPSLNQSASLQEEPRVVTSIDSTNVVSTNPYYGPGNVNNPELLRPVVWCRQMEDVFVDSKIVGKNRELYEASINPSAYLIKSVGVGSTEIFVDNVRPFFNPINETNAGGSDPFVFQRDIIIVSQDTKVSASATSVVSIAGTISSITVLDGGVGYTTSPSVSIAGTEGVGIGTSTIALAIANISNGSVVSIAVTNPGFGYTSSNPPVVLIESPNTVVESNRIVSYEGDFGIITGISTSSVGVASTGLVFDLLISRDSFLRDSDVSGVTTVSGIQTGYYFVVYNSNVGNGVTSLNSDGSIIGIGTTCLDNVYQVSSVSIAQTDSVGFGLTYVAKVTVSLSDYNSLTGLGFSNFYGEYSWGKLTLSPRTELNTFNAYTENGISGIKTGSLISRKNPLKYQNYIL